MDSQPEQLVQQIADEVERRFSVRFDAVEERLGGRLEKRLGERLEGRIGESLEKRLGERLEKQIGESLEKRLGERLEKSLSEAKHELKLQARLDKEELKDQIQKAAEGYAASLDSIDRRLRELNAKVDTKFDDHDRVLANHNERLTNLERRRQR
jgi:aromatic ring-cleaving dioxygenase